MAEADSGFSLVSVCRPFLYSSGYTFIIPVVRFIIFFKIVTIVQRQFADLHFAVRLLDSNVLAPLRRIQLWIVDPVKIQKAAAGFAHQRRMHVDFCMLQNA
jgi:hypothetical protein